MTCQGCGAPLIWFVGVWVDARPSEIGGTHDWCIASAGGHEAVRR